MKKEMEQWRKELIESNIHLAYDVFQKKGFFHDDEELMACQEMLVIAAINFDPSKGFKFSTYYVCCAQQDLKKLRHTRKLLHYRDRKGAYQSVEHLPLDAPTSEDEDFTLLDSIENPSISETSIVSSIYLKSFISSLDLKTRKIVKMKLSGASQSEIGKSLGISQVHVSR